LSGGKGSLENTHFLACQPFTRSTSMWKSLFLSVRQTATGPGTLTKKFEGCQITNPEAVRGGNSLFKEALAELLTSKARQIVGTEYRQASDWRCLNQPAQNWEHSQFIYLSTLTDVSTCTLKRIFGHKCYEDSTENISPKVKEKLRYFLRTENLEETLMNYILQKDNIAK
jgi:hypothetical protein